MRRLARHLFTLCSAVSLLLCVAACVLWVRSHRTVESVWWQGRYYMVSLQSSAGRLGIYGVSSPGGSFGNDSPELLGFHRYTSQVSPDELVDLRDTFGLSTGAHRVSDFVFTWTRERGMLFHNVLAPYWFVAALTAVMPLMVIVRVARSRRRARAGLCVNCGYDLRASPERCPECGTTPAAK
jgi:hypothetical protein